MTFLTGITDGRPDRFRPEVRSVDERVSLTAVVEAISDIMEAGNRGGVADRALASRIGSQIHLAVAQALGHGRISSGADLVGQQAFRNILSQHLATTSSSYTDQAARQSLLDFMRRHANRTGADFANFVAQFRRGGGYADRGSDRDGAGLLTSARFDGFSGADAALLSAMRRYAIDQGLHWAADRPEILRLGHEAIRLLARTGFTRESHDRLHAAGFNHQQMVHIAHYAERTGRDVNEVARILSDSVRVFSGNDEAERRRWLEMIHAFNVDPTNATARDTLRSELERKRREGTAEQKNQAETHLNLMQQADQALTAANAATLQASTAETTLGARVAAVATAQQQTDAIADDLNGAPTRQPTQHVMGPR